MVCMLMGISTYAQKDTLPKFTVHFQQTLVEQYHPDFYSANPVSLQRTSSGVGGSLTGGRTLYSGTEKCMSSTSTLYIGLNVAHNLEFYLNPEVAGGSGFSGCNGIAGFPNGETFRVGDPSPTFYIARAFFMYNIPLNKEKTYREEDQNTLPAFVSSERIMINFGKYSISDFFDGNVSSHDPKTSLSNWALMDCPAWDYPSNTRGYTWALNAKLIKKKYVLRLSTAVNALWSNGLVTANNNFMPTGMDYIRAHGEIAELIFPIVKKGNSNQFIKLMVWANHADMGSYAEATNILSHNLSDSVRLITSSSNLVSPAMDSSRNKLKSPYYGKYGFVANWEKIVKKDRVFVRVGWNDGKRESWMYTEVDQSLSFGTFIGCDKLKRPNDKIRVAVAINGISKEHMSYLQNGGYGFIIGDGGEVIGNKWVSNYQKQNVAESIVELQYNYQYSFLNLSPDVQFIVNPGYNINRGPVWVFGLRAHMYL